jgi:hypothetical protein
VAESPFLSYFLYAVYIEDQPTVHHLIWHLGSFHPFRQVLPASIRPSCFLLRLVIAKTFTSNTHIHHNAFPRSQKHVRQEAPAVHHQDCRRQVAMHSSRRQDSIVSLCVPNLRSTFRSYSVTDISGSERTRDLSSPTDVAPSMTRTDSGLSVSSTSSAGSSRSH